MKDLFNLLITGIVLFIGKEYFSEFVYIGSDQTFILSTVLMVIMLFIYRGLLKSLSKTLADVSKENNSELAGCLGCFAILFILPTAFMLTPIRLWILESIFDDFIVNGFWTYVIIALSLIVFNIKIKKETNEKTT